MLNSLSRTNVSFVGASNFPNTTRTHRARFAKRPATCCAQAEVASNSTNIIKITNLHAKIKEGEREILKGVNLVVNKGEVHAIMGKNGSGKSTLSKCLAGHPDYEITEGTVEYFGEDLLEMEPEIRARKGLFLSFQSPIEIPGVSNSEFLRLSVNQKRKHLGLSELDPMEFFGFIIPKITDLKMDLSFLDRDVNSGFSGGEKKRNEILQLAVLEAHLSILDEIDSGLDIDALKEVSEAINKLLNPDNAVIMVTHYQRLLNLIKPSHVHIMEEGAITFSGGIEVAKILEKEGYEGISKLHAR